LKAGKISFIFLQEYLILTYAQDRVLKGLEASVNLQYNDKRKRGKITNNDPQKYNYTEN
jgi:hypothetical protein